MPGEGAKRPGWPNVVGTIGVFVGTLFVLNQLSDLSTLGWSQADWERLLPSPTAAEAVAALMPPTVVRVVWDLAELALGVLLIVAAWRLSQRQRQRSGVRLCRLWNWLAIAQVVLTVVAVGWWLQWHASSTVLAEAEWRGAAARGLTISAAFFLVFPVSLLLWLSRAKTR